MRLARLIRHLVRQQVYRRCYVESSHWAEFRRAWWRANPNARCATCGCGHPLDLHHWTYARKGHERMTDVYPLCRRDHQLVHGH
jgi:hypothetical protein